MRRISRSYIFESDLRAGAALVIAGAVAVSVRSQTRPQLEPSVTVGSRTPAEGVNAVPGQELVQLGVTGPPVRALAVDATTVYAGGIFTEVGQAPRGNVAALDPKTGMRDRNTKLVVHLSYAGKTIDLPMRDRQTAQQPEREFWVAKWIVPDDAPLGIVRYTITAKDPHGRTGEFKPFDVVASQITIVE